MDNPSIEQLTSMVSDNGRRGAPKIGCDCVQCFGYCLYDNALALRQGLARADDAARGEDTE